MKVTADTRVVVQRTVTVSTETTIGELAHDTGTELSSLFAAVLTNKAQEWIAKNYAAGLVPPIWGIDLDSDVWTVTVQR